MLFISYRSDFWKNTGVAEHDAIRDVPLSGSGAERDVSEEQFKAAIQGQRLLLLIHGYRNKRESVVGGYAMIDRELRRKGLVADRADAYSQVIGIAWPGGLFRVAYPIAKIRANAIADNVFARLRKVVAAAEAVDVMTHSLGARVALKALQNAPIGENCVRHLFLTAPAVDDESIQRGEKFFTATQACRDVYVMYSRHDDVLKTAYRIPIFGDGDRALGQTGPEEVEEVADNVHLTDCSAPVRSHSDYRKRLELYTYIGRVLANQDAPAELPADEGFVPDAEE
jgi:esterase/lipase superfamily enzyme